jgi:DNA-binding transcriptional regulator GbsR (MarR family)
MLLDSESISKSTAITELVYTLIKSYGPITVPQIMHMLKLSGGRVSTSIIELYENKRIIRGHFIENSSYEAFLAADELEFIREFYDKYIDEKKKEIEILPSTDSLAEYWSSADFSNLTNIEKELVLFSGKPICSFDFKIIGDNLHILNLNKTPEYNNNEGAIRDKIQEFAENKGKFLVFPKLQSEEIKTQSVDFAKVLSQRGYSSRSQGLVYHISRFSDVESGRKLLSYSDLLNLLLDYQFLQTRKNFTSKPEVINGLSTLGIPLSLTSLFIRISQGKENLINEMIINKQLVIGKFGAFSRGYISTLDFTIFSKLSTIRQFGVLEEKALNIIKQKEKVNFSQLKETLNLSDRVLLATLHRLESAHEIVQTRSVSNQIIWFPIDIFLKNVKTKKTESQRGAWIEVLYRMLSTQLPLTINQIANITGLSNTQIEVYLKELIASRGVRSGRYIEEEKEVQFTTKEVEETISSFILQLDEIQPPTEQASVIYIPRNDPLIVLYRTYLIRRFKLRSIFLRALPSEYAELVLINGNPAAALHFKKQEKVEYVHNIEILPEYSDTHSMMFVFSSIQEYLDKTKEKSKRQLRIKQIDGIPLYSESGKKYRTLIKDMQLDFLIQP